MKTAQIIKHLLQIPLLDSLSRADLGPDGTYSDLVSLVHEVEYDSGDFLFMQGSVSNRLYYIVEGRVQLQRIDVEDIRRYLGDLEAGDTVGQTSLLVGDLHDATAKVVERTRLLYLERSEFEAYLKEHPRLERELNIAPRIQRRRSQPAFEWLRDDEVVVLWERRHWVNLLRRIGVPVLLFLLTLPVYFLAVRVGGGIITPLLYLVFGLADLVFFLFGLWAYINWRDDYFVLTSQRIVHSERVWPFREVFEEGALENVEDIYVVQSGFAANALNYGDIILQTAGETVEIDLTNINNPSRVRELIFRELERNRARDVLLVRGKIQEKLEWRLRGEEEPPPPEPEIRYEDQRRRSLREAGSPITIFFRAIQQYFFPAAWTISEDGSTIYWRRYWVPGFFRHGQTVFPWLLWTIAGLTAFSIQKDFRRFDLVLFWLVGEAVLFFLVLWFIEDWRNDYFELTPSRIILVFQKPLLLERTRREAQLDNVQNISSEIPNAVARFFKYGHVMLETAGTEGTFALKWVRYPERVSSEISRRQREYFQRMQEQEAQQRQEEMLRWFDVYDTIRHPRSANQASGGTAPEETEEDTEH